MRDDLVRTLIEGAVDRIAAGERADRVLDRTLRDHRDLTSDERRAVAERTLGLALWRGRMDALAGGRRALWLPLFRVDREGAPPEGVAAEHGLEADELRRALATPPPADPLDALALRRSLPPWLAARWSDQWGPARADALAAAMNERGPVAVRANLLRCDRPSLADRLRSEGVSTRPSPLAPHGLLLEGRANILALDSFRAGWFEVQDEASQLVGEALAARPGELVVDLCAGSGGKTLALAGAMENRGRLVAVDLDPARLRDLAVRVRRAGVGCVEARSGDATAAAATADLEGRCDAVLVDAPCSELGVLRRSPDARWRLAPGAPERFSVVQSALLARAARLLGPGGRLVYATCSVDPCEDEAVVRGAPSSLRLEFERRLWPDLDGCDGFYLARLSARRDGPDGKPAGG